MEIYTPYIQETHGIEISVAPVFNDEESIADQNFYLYVYNVTIQNNTSEPIEVIRRTWIIVDGHKQKKIIEGEGIVGEQPVIMPGESFEYSSMCPLETPTGNMRGHYTVKTSEGLVSAKIPLFFLRPMDMISTPQNLYQPLNQ